MANFSQLSRLERIFLDAYEKKWFKRPAFKGKLLEKLLVNFGEKNQHNENTFVCMWIRLPKVLNAKQLLMVQPG